MTEPSYTIAVAKSTHTSEDGWCGDPDSGPGADAGPGQLRPLLPPSALWAWMVVFSKSVVLTLRR